MSGMDMGRMKRQHQQVKENSGQDFGDIPKLIVAHGLAIRLIGDYDSVWEHFAKGPGGLRPFYCEGPDSDCPLCAAVSELSVSEDSDQQKLAGEIKAKEKFYFNALDRTPAGKQQHEADKRAKLLVQTAKSNNIGSMLFRAIGEVCAMRESQGQPSDPNLYDIILAKEGSGMKTSYGAQFSGMVDELTEEEKAYAMVPLKSLTKVSKREELAAAADIAMGRPPRAVAPSGQQEQADNSTTAATAAGPVQAQPPAQVQPAPAPQPAVAPNSTASVPAEAPKKLVIKPKQSEYQDTTSRDGDNIMQVPCSADGCGVDMFIDMDDERDLKCHACGCVYTHPAKG